MHVGTHQSGSVVVVPPRPTRHVNAGRRDRSRRPSRPRGRDLRLGPLEQAKAGGDALGLAQQPAELGIKAEAVYVYEVVTQARSTSQRGPSAPTLAGAPRMDRSDAC